MTNYPPFPDNKTRADYDLNSTEREMASLVVVAWGVRLNHLFGLVSIYFPIAKDRENPATPEHIEQTKGYVRDLDLALDAMEKWKEFRKTC